MNEFLNGLIVGLLIALIILIVTVIVGKLSAKPKVETIKLNPNDFPVPERLPMLDGFKIERGTSVNDNCVTMTWKRKNVTQIRTLTFRDAAGAKELFAKRWMECELAFYTNNRELFTKKSEPTADAKEIAALQGITNSLAVRVTLLEKEQKND